MPTETWLPASSSAPPPPGSAAAPHPLPTLPAAFALQIAMAAAPTTRAPSNPAPTQQPAPPPYAHGGPFRPLPPPRRRKPPRPMTTYHVFSQLERHHLLQVERGLPPNEVVYSSDVELELDPDAPKRPERYRSLVLPKDWYKKGSRTRRARRKAHGKIGFQELTKTIAARWKNVDAETRKYCDGLAKEALEEYIAAELARAGESRKEGPPPSPTRTNKPEKDPAAMGADGGGAGKAGPSSSVHDPTDAPVPTKRADGNQKAKAGCLKAANAWTMSAGDGSLAQGTAGPGLPTIIGAEAKQFDGRFTWNEPHSPTWNEHHGPQPSGASTAKEALILRAKGRTYPPPGQLLHLHDPEAAEKRGGATVGDGASGKDAVVPEAEAANEQGGGAYLNALIQERERILQKLRGGASGKDDAVGVASAGVVLRTTREFAGKIATNRAAAANETDVARGDKSDEATPRPGGIMAAPSVSQAAANGTAVDAALARLPPSARAKAAAALNGAQSFALRLAYMLESAEAMGCDQVVHWSHEGSRFTVRNLIVFSGRVLPQFFGPNMNIGTFLGELKRLGFHGSTSYPTGYSTHWTWRRPKFHRTWAKTALAQSLETGEAVDFLSPHYKPSQPTAHSSVQGKMQGCASINVGQGSAQPKNEAAGACAKEGMQSTGSIAGKAPQATLVEIPNGYRHTIQLARSECDGVGEKPGSPRKEAVSGGEHLKAASSPQPLPAVETQFADADEANSPGKSTPGAAGSSDSAGATTNNALAELRRIVKVKSEVVLSGKNSFPLLLAHMLESAEVMGLSHIVHWSNRGKSFTVRDDNLFADNVLPLYFESSVGIQSFASQLARWGFCMVQPSKYCTWYHPGFNRNVGLAALVRTLDKGKAVEFLSCQGHSPKAQPSSPTALSPGDNSQSSQLLTTQSNNDVNGQSPIPKVLEAPSSGTELVFHPAEGKGDVRSNAERQTLKENAPQIPRHTLGHDIHRVPTKYNADSIADSSGAVDSGRSATAITGAAEGAADAVLKEAHMEMEVGLDAYSTGGIDSGTDSQFDDAESDASVVDDEIVDPKEQSTPPKRRNEVTIIVCRKKPRPDGEGDTKSIDSEAQAWPRSYITEKKATVTPPAVAKMLQMQEKPQKESPLDMLISAAELATNAEKKSGIEAKPEEHQTKRTSADSRKQKKNDIPQKVIVNGEDVTKRPYNRYNIFFKAERARLVQGRGGRASEASTQRVQYDLDLPPLPPRFAHLELSPNLFLSGHKKKRRAHRKGHGVASFTDIARTIACNWKSIDNDTLAWCTRVEKILHKRRKELLKGSTRADKKRRTGEKQTRAQRVIATTQTKSMEIGNNNQVPEKGIAENDATSCERHTNEDTKMVTLGTDHSANPASCTGGKSELHDEVTRRILAKLKRPLRKLDGTPTESFRSTPACLLNVPEVDRFQRNVSSDLSTVLSGEDPFSPADVCAMPKPSAAFNRGQLAQDLLGFDASKLHTRRMH